MFIISKTESIRDKTKSIEKMSKITIITIKTKINIMMETKLGSRS